MDVRLGVEHLPSSFYVVAGVPEHDALDSREGGREGGREG